MSREAHVQFCESVEGRLLCATHLLVLVKSQRAGERVKRSLTRYLGHTLKLTVNEAKSKVAPVSDCAFLSFTFRGKKLRWTDAALADFKHQVRTLTGRSWGVSMDYRMFKLGQ
jgi:RNA-directed DNA polymerase